MVVIHELSLHGRFEFSKHYPEVSQKAKRRKFTAQDKFRILKEADTSTSSGQIGALLRREGLSSSNLTTWRRQQECGTLEALSPKRRGPKEKRDDSSTRRVRELEQEIYSLKQKLKQAETIIEVQKNLRNVEYPFPSEMENRRIP